MLEGFKNFLMRGNVVDLAVGVIIGGAFGAITASLVADVFTPLLGMLFGQPDFSSLVIGANADGKGGILIGKFINSIINFLMVAVAVYFFIVTPMNRLKKTEAPAAPAAPTPDQALLAEIRDLLKK
jgi:large conductance mechanosensitive channel